jgi:protein-arginine kinase
MPCIRCGNLTVKLCTCSIVEAKEAFSAWSEVELGLLINMLRTVLKSRQSS